MTARAVVHIGPIKTGSTALATYFTRASGRGLLPPYLVYPLGDLWFGRAAKGTTRQCFEIARIATSVDGMARFEVSGVDESIAAVAKHLRGLPGKSDKTAVFIAETVTDNRPVAFLQNAFAQHFDEVVFIMVVRRQDKAAASALSQDVRTPDPRRRNLDPRKRPSRFGLPFGEFNHLRNFERWIDGPTNYRLVVIPYLEGEQGSFSSIARFHQAAGIGAPVDLPGIEGHRVHPTFSREGLEALIAAKKQIRRWAWVPGMRARLEERQRQVSRTYLASADSNGIEPSGRKFVPFSLTQEDARWVMEQFDESNREFLSRVNREGFEVDWAMWEKALVI